MRTTLAPPFGCQRLPAMAGWRICATTGGFMIKRVIAGVTVAVAATFGLTAAAQATGGASTAKPAPPARVINLHRAFEAKLGHVKVSKPAGIVYALGKHPKAAKRVQRNCTEPD